MDWPFTKRFWLAAVSATAMGNMLQIVFNPTDARAVAVLCSTWVEPSALAAKIIPTDAACVVTRTYLMEASTPGVTVLPLVLSYHVAFAAKLVENSIFEIVTFGTVIPLRFKPYE